MSPAGVSVKTETGHTRPVPLQLHGAGYLHLSRRHRYLPYLDIWCETCTAQHQQFTGKFRHFLPRLLTHTLRQDRYARNVHLPMTVLWLPAIHETIPKRETTMQSGLNHRYMPMDHHGDAQIRASSNKSTTIPPCEDK